MGKRNMKKRRKVTGLVVLVIIISMAILFNSTSLSSTEIDYIEYTVSNNDALWTIAKCIQENNINYNRTDIREIIYEIKKINSMNTSEIFINDKIIIPEI